MWYAMMTTLSAGLMLMFTKSGRAVIVNEDDKLVESSDDTGSATPFLIVACRAWDDISEELRSNCYSLMDVNRTDWFVSKHSSLKHLQMEPGSATNVAKSSFILHTDSFYPGYYSLECVFNNELFHVEGTGSIFIVADSASYLFKRAASFKLYDYNKFRMYRYLLFCVGIGGISIRIPGLDWPLCHCAVAQAPSPFDEHRRPGRGPFEIF